MICSVCRAGETRPGTATMMLERGELTFVVKDVPALVCTNCGEEYVDAVAAERVLCMAEEAAAAGALIDVRTYKAA